MRNKVAFFGVFTAFALILSYIEMLLPFLSGVQGAKLGLANLAIVIVLYKTNLREALLLSLVRVILSGFLFGNLFSILYSATGGLLSICVMELCRRSGFFGVVGVSIAGGVSHNIGQMLVAAAVLGSGSVFGLIPYFLVAGVLAGAVIGGASAGVLRRIQNIEF